MRAISIMYDSLNRNYLPPYGSNDVIAPNFERLARHTAVLDEFYCGSMPCMPARRELHTGRYNFLMRSWSPLEPFDDSAPELLSQNGICTQFVSDHCHYWQDGGLTYHERFTGFDFVRGQEGDEWHARASNYSIPPQKRAPRRQDVINREYTRDSNCCHARCYESAMDFLKNNVNEDNWYLHLEYFDPHEPFDVPEKYKKLYSDSSITFDWPKYDLYGNQDPEEIRQAIICYKAVISMCDDYLGKVLDYMDEHDMWKDTMLIVNTDHGFMLGEHGFIAKNYMPCYEELVNIPFFIHDPRHMENDGKHIRGLAQTIDIPATLLSYFGLDIPSSMQGKNLEDLICNGKQIHDAILFGYFGKHINVRDDRYVYMRKARDNTKLFEYTLMPTRLAQLFTKEELRMADPVLYDGFEYCGKVPMVKIPANTKYVPKGTYLDYDVHLQYGDYLFDLIEDKAEMINLKDNQDLVDRMTRKMIKLMKETEAPEEQYERMGFYDVQ